MADHKPVRLCIGCRKTECVDYLVRVAFETPHESRSLVFDEQRVLPGRGAWLHTNPQCFCTALRKRAFSRAFRGHVDTEKLEAIAQQWDAKAQTIFHNDESGSEI